MPTKHDDICHKSSVAIPSIRSTVWVGVPFIL